MLRRMFIAFGVMLGLLAIAPANAQNTTGLTLTTCGSPAAPYKSGNPGPFTVNTSGQLCITGSISASLSGFHPETALASITATTGGVTSSSFTAGKTVVVSNAGTTNTAYCFPGIVATTQVQPIAPNGGWFAFTTTSETTITCATSTGTTAVNLVVGTGLPTGTGGGGGGSGGGGAVTVADGADVAEGAVADAAASVGGTGTLSAKLRRMTTQLDAIQTGVGSPVPAGTNLIGDVNVRQGGTALSAANPLPAAANPYPVGAVPYTASATGTTGATAATLAGAASVTTYLCGFSIRANATAAATGNAVVSGTISGSLNFTQWTAPLASGLGLVEQIYSPCIPASAANTSIVVTSAAPGAGGTVSVSAWGYKL